MADSTKQAPETGPTEAEIDTIRAEANAVIEAEGLNKTAAARDAGMAHQTLSAFLAATYTGRNDRVAADVQLWLRSRAERKRVSATMPQAPTFVPTRFAREASSRLQYAQAMPTVAVIAGGAGIGKTKICEHHAATNPNTWLATMMPSTATIHTMMQAVGDAVGVVERNASRLPHAIGRKMAGTGGLLIVDEAQHLPAKCLDQLRALLDLYGVGIALVGNESVHGRLEGGEGRRPEFAQLYSRVGIRFTRRQGFAEDAYTLIKAWDVDDAEAVRILKSIASKPGALRGMTMALRLAGMLAAGEESAITGKHVSAAWARLSDTGSPGQAA